MTFEVGETVVYPHHGAARITDIRQRKVRGEEKTYLQLEVAQGDLTILVPAESVELIGVRDVVDANGLERVFEVLRAPLTEEPTNWSRRFKANQEKIASGDVIKVAEVVRDLSRRDTDPYETGMPTTGLKSFTGMGMPQSFRRLSRGMVSSCSTCASAKSRSMCANPCSAGVRPDSAESISATRSRGCTSPECSRRASWGSGSSSMI